jgi:ribonucleoside-triphosphate reductase (thioredoxin)
VTQTNFGPVGYITTKRTYARRLRDTVTSPTEEFPQIIDRVIRAAKTQLDVGFTSEEEHEVRDMMLSLKGLVAGRFLWQLGTRTVDKLGLMSLQNCAVTVINEPIRPFTWAMDALMLGSGVGFNLQRENVYQLPHVKRVKIVRQDTNDADYIVPDSREGWVALLERVLEAHFKTGKGFTYSTVCVRGKGTQIKGFGGVSSGPEELCWGMAEISKVLNARAGKRIRPIDALDMMNIIGYVVVSGNVRRSAQIAIGDMDDIQFLNAKRWDLGNIPNWRAMSNNSIVCNDIENLPEQFWQGYQGNGEPYGLINLHLAQLCGRLGEEQYPDPDVVGFNPLRAAA